MIKQLSRLGGFIVQKRDLQKTAHPRRMQAVGYRTTCRAGFTMYRISTLILWATILSLALPGGWCRALAELSVSSAAATPKGCCCPAERAGKTTDESSNTGCTIPSSPATCCCEARLPAPVESAALPLVALLAFSGWLPVLSPSRLSLTADPSEPRTDFGPRLHVVQCVWRC